MGRFRSPATLRVVVLSAVGLIAGLCFSSNTNFLERVLLDARFLLSSSFSDAASEDIVVLLMDRAVPGLVALLRLNRVGLAFLEVHVGLRLPGIAQHPSRAADGKTQERQIDGTPPGYMRVEDCAVAPQAARLQVDATGVDRPQWHPVGGGLRQSVYHSRHVF